MNKKRLLALPIVCIVVAMLGVAVMASSATKGFKVEDGNGTDITNLFDGPSASSIDLSTVSGLQDKLSAVDKDVKVSDLKYVVGYDVTPKAALDTSVNPAPYKVTIFVDVAENEIAVLIHVDASGNVVLNVIKGKATEISGTVDSFSPFLVYKATVQKSAQTGEYAAPYIIMISVALVSCGAIFAIRAKKATK